MHHLLQKLWGIYSKHNFREGQTRVEALLSQMVDLSQSIQSTEAQIAAVRSEQLQKQADAAASFENRLQTLEDERAEVQLRRCDLGSLSEHQRAELQQRDQEITDRISEAQRVHELALQSARRAGEMVAQKHQARLVEQQCQQVEHRAQLRQVIRELKPIFMVSLDEEQHEEL